MIAAHGSRCSLGLSSDHFDWLSAYIRERGLQTQWRVMIVCFTLTLAAIPVMLTASPTGPNHPLSVAVSVTAAACSASSAVLWIRRWPTSRQSIAYSIISTCVIAATCLSQSSPYAALMGCTTFAILGGFAAYFHSLGIMAVNLSAAVTCAVIAVSRLIAATADIALAASALLIVLGLNVGVPFGIYSLGHSLRRDLRTSGHDSLTGLLGRRSFFASAYELMMRDRGRAGRHFVVVLIDLDDFKGLNDALGHSAGDRALVAVGAELRDACPGTAVIGRIGGEEFVIADSSDVSDPAELGERLRRAVADIPFPVTASIGTTSVDAAIAAASGPELIEELVHVADLAMYEAKNAGGDRVCHRAAAA